jgi:nucleolar protein 6
MFANYCIYSAGGGGNTPARQEKIKAKNEKLGNERLRIRERRDEVEVKQKERKEKKEARAGGKADGAAAGEEEKPAEENVGIHPARLAMMKQEEKPKPWQTRTRF